MARNSLWFAAGVVAGLAGLYAYVLYETTYKAVQWEDRKMQAFVNYANLAQ